MIFHEEQRFTQSKWIWIVLIILIISVLPLIWGTYDQLVHGKPFGDEPMSDMELVLTDVLTFGILGGIAALLFYARLITEVHDDGIHVRYPPFVRKWEIYTWADLVEAEVRQYKPIREYGGWGWRMGLFFKGRAYNVSGNKGLQLVTTAGKRLMIGTQRSKELATAIAQVRR